MAGNKPCYMSKCSARLVLPDYIYKRRHKWWRTEKSNMASKMAANFTVYLRFLNNALLNLLLKVLLVINMNMAAINYGY